MNLADLLRTTAQNYPNKIAIIDGARAITYSELWILSQSLSQLLSEAGIRKGYAVGIRLPNSIDYVALTYALWKSRAVVVPIAMELKESEVTHLNTALSLNAVISCTKSEGASALTDPHTGRTYYIAVQSSQKNNRIKSTTAFIRFSSGTTGRCKGIILTHTGIFKRIQAANRGLHITSDDTIVWVLSMAHHFAATIVLYCTQGATIVLVNNALANSIINAVNRTKATILYAAPFHYVLLAADPSARMLPSLRAALSTTTALPEHIAMSFLQRYNIAIAQVYGIIELGLVCINTMHPADKPNSVGKSLPDYQIKIRNTNDDKSKQNIGTIHIKGPGFFEGYCSPWMPAKKVLQDGWFDTGDVGYYDDAGYLYLCGRTKDVINFAGEKVFPLEVEAALNGHYCVKESCVYREMHPRFGELVVADVVLAVPLEPDEARNIIFDYCKKHLVTYKIPYVINIVKRIPKTPVTLKIINDRHAQTPGERG